MTTAAAQAPDRPRQAAGWLYAAAVLFSAVLVFSVQPMVGKLLLPALGGGAGVWITSLAFFQAALLAGYGYAHLLQCLASLRVQMMVHAGVLAVAAFSLPLAVTSWLGEPWSGAPALWLLAALCLSVGPAFVALSATAPLIQAWAARTGYAAPGGRDVYGLYAASNLGSLAALIAYPVLIEPLLGLASQTRIWSLAYSGFGLVLLALIAASWRGQTAAGVVETSKGPPTTWRDRLAWVALAAVPSSLLASVTAHISADVAAAPFLWVPPLALYLITFIIAFARPGRPAGWVLNAQVMLTPAALLTIASPGFPLALILAVHLAAFFVAALVCHQSLAARRPPPERLTEFYLLMSLGGLVGGAFSAFVAPLIFNTVIEYPVVLALACLARPESTRPESARPGRAAKAPNLTPGEKLWLLLGLIWVAPATFPGAKLPEFVAIALMLAPGMLALVLRERPRAVALLFGVLAMAALSQGIGRYDAHHRSFYGVTHLRVDETPDLGRVRMMVHGTTIHGVQILDPARRCAPTSYYAPATGIGQAFAGEAARRPALRTAVVGLGAGVTAAFARPADRLTYFEIDPLIVRLAGDPATFTFLSACAGGRARIVTGDARLKLEHEPAGAFDLLLVDAFSSDSVPSHLLTVESIRTYLRVLAPDGLLVMHLSNRHLALEGPAAAAVKAAGADALYGEHWAADDVSNYAQSSTMVLLASRSPATLDRYRGAAGWRSTRPDPKPWTDDKTNILGALVAGFRRAGEIN